MSFKFDSKDLRKNLAELDPKIHAKISAIVDYQSAAGEVRMRTGAPWHDNTGAARAGLFTHATHESDRHTILFAHSVAYGIWLEVANSGKYQIILPVIRIIGRDTMHQIQDVFGRI